MSTDKFNSVLEESNEYGESNDCTVKAVTLVSDLPYGTVHRMYHLAGRKRRCGARREITQDVLHQLGENGYRHYWCQPLQKSGSRFTMKTIGKAYPKGRYIVRVRGHLAAMIDGVIHDWTQGRRHIVTEICQVVKPGEKKYERV